MNNELTKHAVDAAAATIAVATIAKWLPPLAAALTIVWTVLRIYDWVSDKWANRSRKN